MPPAATTAMQSEMFAFGREYLDKRNYRRLSSAHWSANNRERSWYNILAKADVPIFPFGSGSGGNVGGGMEHSMVCYTNSHQQANSGM